MTIRKSVTVGLLVGSALVASVASAQPLPAPVAVRAEESPYENYALRQSLTQAYQLGCQYTGERGETGGARVATVCGQIGVTGVIEGKFTVSYN